MKESLTIEINTWLSLHPNPYNQPTEEKVYWNMLDILSILKATEEEIIITSCKKMFDRFKYYY